MPPRRTSTYGFARTSSLLNQRIQRASESRGFAQTRLLTHWPEVAGEDIAAIARPVNVSFGRGGLGATLTVLTTGANAPLLEMQKEQLRQKVNAVYGYNAISRIRITQTAPTGFAEGQAQFTYGTAPKKDPQPDPKVTAAARHYAEEVMDADLKGALEALARNVLSKAKT
ncbi:DUF721 domain-containing protein [Marinovum sp. 2_MG-2023]|uniref:DUF721 domain-containing protein n=1 Tax=unclassified Marinovum TaxID=2647166 RepID=UPI0026E17D9D|nr:MULTISPECIES: DUF721 domain-containing protein [unclassified Marinovum]MDO6729709.1 DUF721 domain-containing protein [Marinovum sp. 2_MG-2023]MDO6779523.1 DUF721 domain-containing protein [Marinovum sp. 1_MG-2023]